jgi:hypothetical protein
MLSQMGRAKLRAILMSVSVIGFMMAAVAQGQADNAHYNDPSSVCFRERMKEPPNCWANFAGKVCDVKMHACARRCHYSLQ